MKIQQSLHILHLTDGNRGGSQRHIIDLCNGDAADTRHFVLRIVERSLSLHDAQRSRVLVTAQSSDAAALIPMVRRVLGELAIDVVHAHSLPVLLEFAEAAGRPLAGLPLIVTLHDLGCIDANLFAAPNAQPQADARWVARCAPVLRQAAAVIVPSDFLAGVVRRHYPDVQPVVIPNGIGSLPDVALPIVRPGPQWPPNARVFAVVGALGPHKGSEALLRVADALTSPDIAGVVIGYTDAQLTTGWLVPGRLFVHGRYAPDELPGLLAAYQARFAYFPNVIPESFSYALSEVWQSGIPALVPAIGALGDRVRATGAGWLLEPPLDALAAAAEIERLLSPAGTAALAAARDRLAAAGAVPAVAA
ncbi:MAG: glycosyltransferase family 4 protein, partial [Betaproteobacteria bacterium]